LFYKHSFLHVKSRHARSSRRKKLYVAACVSAGRSQRSDQRASSALAAVRCHYRAAGLGLREGAELREDRLIANPRLDLIDEEAKIQPLLNVFVTRVDGDGVGLRPPPDVEVEVNLTILVGREAEAFPVRVAHLGIETRLDLDPAKIEPRLARRARRAFGRDGVLNEGVSLLVKSGALIALGCLDRHRGTARYFEHSEHSLCQLDADGLVGCRRTDIKHDDRLLTSLRPRGHLDLDGHGVFTPDIAAIRREAILAVALRTEIALHLGAIAPEEGSAVELDRAQKELLAGFNNRGAGAVAHDTLAGDLKDACDDFLPWHRGIGSEKLLEGHVRLGDDSDRRGRGRRCGRRTITAATAGGDQAGHQEDGHGFDQVHGLSSLYKNTSTHR
jgi:hypothetical protein